MSSLNILCAICCSYFKNSDIIYSTRCGHVFHKDCLFQWLKSSPTCPQCRRSCPQHNCHQLFVNYVEKSLFDNAPEFEFPKIYEWIYIDHDVDPNDDLSFAFKFGQDEEGNDIYAARGRYNGDLIPGYFVPHKRSVIAPWGFKSHCLTDDIELLDISNDDAEYKWVAASGGNIPEYSFATGLTAMGDILYTARAKHGDKILYGKLHQRYKLAYMPYKEIEVSNGSYDILVRIPKEVTTNSSSTDNPTNEYDG